jgi:hypothetical protein
MRRTIDQMRGKHSWGAIAAKIGVDVWTLRQYRERAGIAGCSVPPGFAKFEAAAKQRETIRKRRGERWSVNRIASELGVCGPVVRRWLVDMGLPTKLPPL